MKTISLLNSARERGISLIEGVLYLVIALAVIVGGIVFFQQAQLSNQVTDTARASVGISSQARALYQNQRDFGTSEITPALEAAGAVPSNFQDGSGGIVHPFGGAITVNGNGDTFAMTLTDLSEAACLRLASVGEGGQGPMGTGIAGVTLQDDASTIVYDGTAAPGVTAPVTASDLASTPPGGCADDIDAVVYYNR